MTIHTDGTVTTRDAAQEGGWSDPATPAEDRVRLLLESMTVAEKVGQLGSIWLQGGNDGNTGNVAPMQDVFGAGRAWEDVVEAGLGHLTRPFGTAAVDPVTGATELAERQRELVDRSRLGIPAIAHDECLTGFTTFGATVYPTPLAWAATFDPALVERVGSRIGADMRSVDVHQGLSPVLDVVRDPRWGRTEETLGEDPYLVGLVGAGYVRGLEQAGIVATLKHFVGYSASRAARNHAPVSTGRRELLEVLCVPFEMALRLGGARSVMNSYADIDGVPPAVDHWLLGTVLRDRWGFEGTVVSDYWSISFLVSMHRVAADQTAAGALALAAGIDVELPGQHCYDDGLVALVDDGEVDESLLDRSVARVLRTKLELGLLDAGWAPHVPDAVDLDPPANRALAREVAARSLVLLANDGTLPLADDVDRLAVLGPCADDPLAFLGCYSFPNHVLQQQDTDDHGIEVPSLLAALAEALPGAELSHAAGCAVDGDDTAGIEDAARAASDAGRAVLVLGDRAGLFGRGTSGEGNDAADLRLPGVQHELADAVLATGVPVVLLLVGGRPYALGDLADRAAAVVCAFMPGEEGGPALADLLLGRTEPVGRLPVQLPREPGGQPATYLHPTLGEPGLGISSADTHAAFAFGHGLSWTSFEHTSISASTDELGSDGELVVTTSVRNTGDVAGEELVQLYLDDPVASVVRPVRQLLGFHRVRLEPGASAEVDFHVHADRLAFVGTDLEWVVEPGTVRFLAGASSADLPLEVEAEVVGEPRTVGHDRVLVTPTEDRPQG